jgi:ankyrin repeat protein
MHCSFAVVFDADVRHVNTRRAQRIGILKMLLNHKPDLTIRDADDMMPLHLAASASGMAMDPRIAEDLLKAGTKVFI